MKDVSPLVTIAGVPALPPIRSCPLCGRDGVVRHRAVRDRWFGSPGSWTFLECTRQACDCAWPQDEQITEHAYDAYYTHEPPVMHSGWRGVIWSVFPSPWAAQRSRRRASLATDVIGQGPGKALDVGCGAGQALRELAKAGWSPTGFETDPVAAEVARQASGCPVLSGTLDELPEGTYDLVLASHVIEHVDDPIAFAAECHRLLKPGGRFVAYTPNVGSWSHRVFGGRWRGLEAPRHRALLGPISARSVLDLAGFGDCRVFSDPNMEGFLAATSAFGDGKHSSRVAKAAFYVVWCVGQMIGDVVGLLAPSQSGELCLVGRRPLRSAPHS